MRASHVPLGATRSFALSLDQNPAKRDGRLLIQLQVMVKLFGKMTTEITGSLLRQDADFLKLRGPYGKQADLLFHRAPEFVHRHCNSPQFNVIMNKVNAG